MKTDLMYAVEHYLVPRLKCVTLYLNSCIHLNDVVVNYVVSKGTT